MTSPNSSTTYIPDPRDDTDPLSPPPSLRQASYEFARETYNRRRQTLAQLHTKIEHQKRSQASLPSEERIRFKRTDDVFLLMFLRCKRFRVDKAFTEYTNFCRAQVKYPWLQQLDMSVVESLFASSSFQILPACDRQGRLILSMDFKKLIPFIEQRGKNITQQLLAAIFGMLETVLCDVRTQIFGVTIVCDLAECTLRTFSIFTLSEYLLSLELCQNCYPIRASGMYVIHEPWYVKGLFKMMRPFMKQKVKDNLICFGTDVFRVHEFIRRESLLPTYGGLLNFDHSSHTKKWVQAVRQTLSSRCEVR